MTKEILDVLLKVFFIVCVQAVLGVIYLTILASLTPSIRHTSVGLVKLFKHIIKDSNLEWVFIDGTHIKAHQHSSGTCDKQQAISKSVAGRASKIHLAVDAHGNPVTFIITDGTTHDVKVASDLIDDVDLRDTAVVCADKGYVEPTPRQVMTIWTGTYTRLDT